jgi:hypothetical protein
LIVPFSFLLNIIMGRCEKFIAWVLVARVVFAQLFSDIQWALAATTIEMALGRMLFLSFSSNHPWLTLCRDQVGLRRGVPAPREGGDVPINPSWTCQRPMMTLWVPLGLVNNVLRTLSISLSSTQATSWEYLQT